MTPLARIRHEAHRRWLLTRFHRTVRPREFAAFGPRSYIVLPATIVGRSRIHIGADTLVHEGVWLGAFERYEGHDYTPTIRIGDRTVIARNNYISCVGEVTIGNDVFTGANVVVADSYHEYRDPHTAIRYQPMAEPRPVRIGDGVIINPNVCILMGVTIGARSFIGAGSVVTRDVPENAVALGNPARVVRRFDHDRGEWVEVDR